MTEKLSNRRSVLRGSLNGAGVVVGLPLLDCFLNTNGTALAADGSPLPANFGTWFWGCGLNPTQWEPKTVGPGYAITPALKPLEKFKSKMNVYSGMKVFLDGKPLVVHFSGNVGLLTGTVPRGQVAEAPSIDSLIADHIGNRTRFRSIEVCCSGNPAHSQSRRQGNILNPGETSPLALYTRIFGADFKDPNAADFKVDPMILVRKSALSTVSEQRADLVKQVGARDRARLDEYFTSVRQLEQQLELETHKPAPLEACTVPDRPTDVVIGTEVESAKGNHRLFARLLAHALACGQTRVVNIDFCDAISSLRRAGASQTHHIYTHEEPSDASGFQPNVTWFHSQIMESFAVLLNELDSIREGDATLLDRTVIFASTDTGLAKIHSPENIAMMTVGSGGGRLKTGIHVAAGGDAVTRVGLTLQQAFGMPVSSWGTESQMTSKTISEVMA
jgi:hypothetical protein